MKYPYTLLLFSISLLGRTQGTSEWLDINDARVRFYSNGHIARVTDDNSTGYFVPASANTSPLYSAGLWIGGVDNNGQLRVAAQIYGVEQDFFPGPLTTDGSASISGSVSQAYDQIWKIDRSDVSLHQDFFLCLQDPGCDPLIEFPNYQIPDEFQTWPAHGDESENQALYLAPFFDLEADNLYDPTNGDHPCVPGDQALYMIFNDNTAPHMQSLGLPIGLEVHMTPFAYTNGDPALERTVFVHYKLINRSSHTVNDVFVGTFADGDLGCANDDFIGSDVGRNMMFFYNWDDVDDSCGPSGAGYGSTPPALGVVTLKGPMVDGNSIDDDLDLSLPSYNGSGFNDGLIDNERHGLSRMISFHREGSQFMTDPSMPTHYYNYLRGIWKNGVSMSYGGNGYTEAPQAVPAYFMYPWDTDMLGVGTDGIPMTDWRETQITPALPDRRGIASMGPFMLEPGEEDDILIAYVFARAETGGAVASVDALKARVDSVRAFAETIPGIMAPGSPCDELPTSISDRSNRQITMFPNPADEWLGLQLDGSSAIQIYDVRGSLMHQSRLPAGRSTIDTSHLPAGLYHLVGTDRKGTLSGRFIKQ